MPALSSDKIFESEDFRAPSSETAMTKKTMRFDQAGGDLVPTLQEIDPFFLGLLPRNRMSLTFQMGISSEEFCGRHIIWGTINTVRSESRPAHSIRMSGILEFHSGQCAKGSGPGEIQGALSRLNKETFPAVCGVPSGQDIPMRGDNHRFSNFSPWHDQGCVAMPVQDGHGSVQRQLLDRLVKRGRPRAASSVSG